MARRNLRQIISDRGFDHAKFDLDDQWYHQKLWQKMPVLRIITGVQEEEIRAGLGPDAETFKHIAQIARSPKGYETVLTMSGQEIQTRYRPDGTIAATTFRHSHVHEHDARHYLEKLERSGAPVDIEKLKITGSKTFVRSMKAALLLVQEQRNDAVLNVVTAKHQEMRQAYVQIASRKDIDPRLKASLGETLDVINAIATRLSEGAVPSAVMSGIYKDFKSRSRPVNPVEGQPDWHKMAKDLGLHINDPKVKPDYTKRRPDPGMHPT